MAASESPRFWTPGAETRKPVPVSYTHLNSTCTRANLARFLVDNGEIPSMREAFDRYLGDHAKCYVPREEVTPAQTIDLIHQCGGIAVFAPPVPVSYTHLLHRDSVLLLLLPGIRS